jgi:acetyltransferase
MSKNLDNFFYPESIAIIGASSREKTLGWELISNLLKFGYRGKIFPVNPKAEYVHSIKTYPSVTDILDKVSLSIIMVGKEYVLSAIDDCMKKRIKDVIVITAGFKEVGKDGEDLERLMMEKIKKYNMNLVGPNCMGIINTKPEVMMNGTFVQGEPNAGGIGFVSQSGALGAAILKILKQRDIGFSQFLSIGNKADIDENDVLEYWSNNEDVKVITLYLESFSDIKRFREVAGKITRKKPVITVKAARTGAGMKAASSHTGAIASSDAFVDAVFNQTGVIRVDTVEDLFDLAKSFDRTILPSGNRLGILTNAGGPAILTVDEAQKWGLTIPELTSVTKKKLQKICVPEASLHNPIDILPPATAEVYGKATELMLSDKNIDCGIVILGPPLMHNTLEIGKKICEAGIKSGKSVAVVLMSQDDVIQKLAESIIPHPPIFNSCESAARVMGLMYKYKVYKESKVGEYERFAINTNAAKKVIKKYSGKGEVYMEFGDVVDLLLAYRFPIVESVVARNVQESIIMAETIGFPVVIKAIGKKLIHKSDVGGVVLNIKNVEELVQAENRVLANLKEKNLDKAFEGFTIQPYLEGGVETLLGSIRGPNDTNFIAFGMGGVLVEVFKDVSFCMAPLTDKDAENLIKNVRVYNILKGVRGKKSVDFDYVSENILKLSQMVMDFPEILEVDFNPFVFSDKLERCKILDARIKVSVK